MKKGDDIASGAQTLNCCQSFELKSIELTFLHFIKVFVRATRLCHLSKLKNDAVPEKVLGSLKIQSYRRVDTKS